MTKKRAHPTTGTSAPAAAPERFRGKVASAESNAILRGAVIRGAERHQERHECRLTHAADHGVERSGEHEQPHLLAREREPHVEQIGERLADTEYQQRAKRPPANVHAAAERHADHGRHGHVELAGDAELIQRESHAAQHERAVEAERERIAHLVEQHQRQESPHAFLRRAARAADARPHRPGCGADGPALCGSGAQKVTNRVAAMRAATNRKARRQPRWPAMTTSTVPASIAAVR